MSTRTRILAALVLLSTPAAAWCQPWEYSGAGSAEKETVVGAGTVSLQRPPKLLRMFLQITGKGKTLDVALAQLRQRREKATATLNTLAADPKSISFTCPTTGGASESQQRRQMEMMIRQRMSPGGRLAKALKLPEVVNVGSLLTAQWTLDSDDAEKAVVRAHELQQSLKAADLAGIKDKSNLTAEEQEMAEEMEGAMAQMGSYGSETGLEQGTPMFMYVATISDADANQALADAFGKAKADAARLARAAGARPGRLLSVSGGLTPSQEYYNMQQYVPMPYRNTLSQQLGNRMRGDSQKEAVSTDPNNTVFQFHLRAAFALDSGAGDRPGK